VPDIIFPDVLNYSTFVGETALDNPLPWDTIKPAKYEKFNLVEPYLGVLHSRSDARLATNQDFAYVRQDIDQFQKMQADKTATLNEREAIKERERVATQNIEREKERDARPPAAVKIYDVTVENADQPGLTENVDPSETNAAAYFDQTNSTAINKALAGLANDTTNATNSTKARSVEAAAKKKAAPAIDPMLDETERILEDYISLLNRPLIANH
jgi:carboxyl-terminal processing protease